MENKDKSDRVSLAKIQARVIERIKEERLRQDAKWGFQRHDMSMWLAILGEEYGETCKGALEHIFGNRDISSYREEMEQTAAVAIAALEHLEEMRLNPKVYLAGPIANCNDGETFNWREYAAEKIDIECLDPASQRDFRNKHIEDAQKQIIMPDKRDIDASSIVLANCWQVSVGTSMEIIYSWERGKYVVLVIPDGAHKSPWATGHAHYVAKDLDEAIIHINEMVKVNEK